MHRIRVSVVLPALLAACCSSAALGDVAPPGAVAEEEAELTGSSGSQYGAIVNVECSSLNVDYRTPWNPARPSGGTGTAFLIAPGLFLTNAHVVSDASRVVIRKVGDSTPYRVHVKHIAHDCDLALLELPGPARAFENVKPLKIGEAIPRLDSTVKVVGYPVGGERISVTRGVVSRVDYQGYTHSGADQHLAIQIDAAINPGNSGGPVLQNGEVIGVAFQGYSGDVAQNTGYMIPTTVIHRFLKDIEDGRYDRYVDLAISYFPILNPAQRRALSLPEEDVGVLITDVQSDGSCGGVLEVGDVLMAIDGHRVQSNGSIDFEGEQLEMAEIVERKFAGDSIRLTVWRDGKTEEKVAVLKPFSAYLIHANQYEKRPEYVMYAGLVFQPLDKELMSVLNPPDLHTRYCYNYYLVDELYRENPEFVVLTNVLPDAINTWVREYTGRVVEEINGVRIRSMEDVRDAIGKGPDGDHVVIRLKGEGRPLTLEKRLIPDAQARIRERYGVAEDAWIDP